MEAVSLFYGIVRNFEIAFITLFTGLLISRLVGKVIKRMLAEAELNKLFAAKGARTISDILGSTTEGLLYLVTVLIVLKQLGLTNLVFYVIMFLLAIFILFFVFLCLKQAQNILAWLMIRSSLNKNLGKIVHIGDITGKLESVGLFQSRLNSTETFLVPHAYSWKHNIRAKRTREG